MRVLVAGGAGYIGSVVTAALVADGHEVTVLDDLSTGHADAVPEGATLAEVSLHDSAPVLASVRPEAVLHFAARSTAAGSSSPRAPPPTASPTRCRSARTLPPGRRTPTAPRSSPSTTC